MISRDRGERRRTIAVLSLMLQQSLALFSFASSRCSLIRIIVKRIRRLHRVAFVCDLLSLRRVRRERERLLSLLRARFGCVTLPRETKRRAFKNVLNFQKTLNKKEEQNFGEKIPSKISAGDTRGNRERYDESHGRSRGGVASSARF